MDKKQLTNLLADLEIIKKDFIRAEDITDDMQDKVVKEEHYHYIYEDKLSDEDKKLALLATQTKDIRSIKNILKFFVILTVIAIVVYFIMIFSRGF